MRFGSPEYKEAQAEYDKNPSLCKNVNCRQPIPFRIAHRGAKTCSALCRNEVSRQARVGVPRRPARGH